MKRKGCGPRALGSPIKQSKPLTRQQQERQIERREANRQERRLEQQERRQTRSQNKTNKNEAVQAFRSRVLEARNQAVDTTDN